MWVFCFGTERWGAVMGSAKGLVSGFEVGFGGAQGRFLPFEFEFVGGSTKGSDIAWVLV